MAKIKDEAKKLIDNLPDKSTWDDIMYEIYVRQKIEVGLKAAKEGKTISFDKARKKLLLK